MTEERTLDEMKLDLVRWKLEDAEYKAEQEYKQLCQEKPKVYGEKPFCIRETTYKASYYKTICEDVLFYISLSDHGVRYEWEHWKAKKEEFMYAE